MYSAVGMACRAGCLRVWDASWAACSCAERAAAATPAARLLASAARLFRPLNRVHVLRIHAIFCAALQAMAGMKAGKGGIIANPNCSTIIALMAVTPLHRAGECWSAAADAPEACG